MPDILLVVIGVAALFFGGTGLVRGASRLAGSFGISATVVALTIVAVGTSIPELLVAINAAQRGTGTLALGNVLGSNVANIGLILGLSAVIAPMVVERQTIRREIPLLMVATVVGFVIALDGELSRVEGGVMLLGFVAFIGFSYTRARKERRAPKPDVEPEEISRVREGVRVVVGCVLLALGANWTVDGATAIARSLGVSDLVIGLTLVAFGTSLPELASSVIAAWRKQPDIIVGNVIGSNIANILLILGATALVDPLTLEANALQFEFPVMIGFTLLLGGVLLRPQTAALGRRGLAGRLRRLYGAAVRRMTRRGCCQPRQFCARPLDLFSRNRTLQ